MMRQIAKAPCRALVFAPFLSLEGPADRPRFVASVLAELMPVDVVTSDFDHTRKAKREPQPCTPFAQVTYLEARPYGGNVSVARLISHLLFGFRAAAYFRRNRNKYNIVYATAPLNVLTWLIFSLASAKTKILDVVDIWPDTLPFPSWVRMPLGPVLSSWKWFFQSSARMADLIMAVSDNFLIETATYANDEAKVERFYIGQKRLVSSTPKQPIFTVAYVGNLGRLYDFDTLLDVLSEDGLRDCMQLFVVGGGDRQDWLVKELERRKIRYQFFGVVFEPDRLGKILRSCHVGFNGYINTTAAFSYKATTYFAADLPIINSMPGDLQRLVIEHGLGENYIGGNKRDLRDCLLRLYSSGTTTMAANCERFFTSQLDTSKIALAMKDFFVANICETRYVPKAMVARATEANPLSEKIIPPILKRTFDIAAAASAVLVISPLLLLSAIAVRVHMGSPALFRQTRIGLRGVGFEFLKFRTMRDMRGPDGRQLPDEARLTGLGDFLRRWSLDELPQLWNVVRGEMSLVGPRPLLPRYLPRYSNRQARRHEVPPGITGWAQVNGRNALSWDEKLELDVWYVEHQSLWLDCRILWMTVVQLFRHKGISAAGHATMPEFMGSGGDQPAQLPSEKVGQ